MNPPLAGADLGMSAAVATEGRIGKSVKKRVLQPQTAHRSGQRVKNEAIKEMSWRAFSLIQSVHGGGLEPESPDAGNTLLCLRTCIPQANAHLDQHNTLDPEGHDRHRTLRAEVQRRALELGGTVEAQVRDSSREQQGSTRQGQEGMEEYGATTTSRRALESHELNDDSHRVENMTETIEGAEGGFRPD